MKSRPNWVPVRLSDVADIKHGYAFAGEFFRDDPPGDILLTPGNFALGGGFKADKLKYYVGPVPAEFVLREGDLIVTMTDLSKAADTLGYPALVPNARVGRYLHNQRLGRVLIRPDSGITKDFLYYVMRTAPYRQEVLASATGTTVKHTSPDRIRAFSFLLPPKGEQRNIAEALRTLDDKIDLNRRLSGTLEAMARAIFNSWFVNFDPVRAKMEGRRPAAMDADTAALFPNSFQDSESGKPPTGWQNLSLPKVVEVNPTRSLRRGEVAPYLDMANMPSQGHSPDTVVKRAFGSGMRFMNGDTLVARITPCLENGKTAYVDFLDEGDVGWGSTEYIVLRPKPPLPTEFAYCLARGDEFRRFAIQKMTGSSGRQRVPADSLFHFAISVPGEEIARAFGKLVKPLFAHARAAAMESRTLAELRDKLLPKLISGQVRV